MHTKMPLSAIFGYRLDLQFKTRHEVMVATRVNARNEFEGDNFFCLAPRWIISTLEWLILLLNALKSQLKLLNFKDQKKKISNKIQVEGDMPSNHPPLAETLPTRRSCGYVSSLITIHVRSLTLNHCDSHAFFQTPNNHEFTYRGLTVVLVILSVTGMRKLMRQIRQIDVVFWSALGLSWLSLGQIFRDRHDIILNRAIHVACLICGQSDHCTVLIKYDMIGPEIRDLQMRPKLSNIPWRAYLPREVRAPFAWGTRADAHRMPIFCVTFAWDIIYALDFTQDSRTICVTYAQDSRRIQAGFTPDLREKRASTRVDGAYHPRIPRKVTTEYLTLCWNFHRIFFTVYGRPNFFSLYTYSAIGLSLWRASLRALISMYTLRNKGSSGFFHQHI
jgi:hypothetical protein